MAQNGERDGGLLPYFHLQDDNLSVTGDFTTSPSASVGPSRAASTIGTGSPDHRILRAAGLEAQTRRSRRDNGVRPHQGYSATRPQFVVVRRPPIQPYLFTESDPAWRDAPLRIGPPPAVPLPSLSPRASNAAPPGQLLRSSTVPSRPQQSMNGRVSPPARPSPSARDAHSAASTNSSDYPSFETVLALSAAPTVGPAAVAGPSRPSTISKERSESSPVARATTLDVNDHASVRSISSLAQSFHTARECQGAPSPATTDATIAVRRRRNGSIMSDDYGMISKGFSNQISIMITPPPEDDAVEPESSRHIETHKPLPALPERPVASSSATIPRRIASLSTNQVLRLVSAATAKEPQPDRQSPVEYITEPQPTAATGNDDTAHDSLRTNSSAQRDMNKHALDCACQDCYQFRTRRRFTCARVCQRLKALSEGCRALEADQTYMVPRSVVRLIDCAHDVAKAKRMADHIASTSSASGVFADMPEAQEEERFNFLLQTISRLEGELRAMMEEHSSAAAPSGAVEGVAKVVKVELAGPATPVQSRGPARYRKITKQ